MTCQLRPPGVSCRAVPLPVQLPSVWYLVSFGENAFCLLRDMQNAMAQATIKACMVDGQQATLGIG